MGVDNKTDSQKTMDLLLDHVLFPRVLPQEKAKRVHELELLMKLIENVENLSKWLPSKTVKMLQRLKRVQIECTPAAISEEINDLQPGKVPLPYFHSSLSFQNKIHSRCA